MTNPYGHVEVYSYGTAFDDVFDRYINHLCGPWSKTMLVNWRVRGFRLVRSGQECLNIGS